MSEVAELTLAITGKDDASRALESVGQAASALVQALSGLSSNAESGGQSLAQLGASGSSAGAGLSGIASQASAGASGLDSLGSSASGSAGGLDDVAGSAENAGSATGDAGSSAENAGSGFDALGAGTRVASEGLNSAAEGAAAFGFNAGPAAAAGGELLGVVDNLGNGLGNVATAGALAAVAIVGIGVAIAGSVLSSTAEWADKLGDMATVSGIDENALAGLQVRLEEVGGSLDDAGSAFAYLSRQMEGMATDAEKAGEDAAAAAEKQGIRTAAAAADAGDQLAELARSTAQGISDAQASLAQAYADTQQAIADATEKEVSNLDDLATKHAETIAKIKSDIASLTEDYATAEQDRVDKFNQSAEDRKRSEQDSQDNRDLSHKQALERIALREKEANERLLDAQRRLSLAKTDSERVSAQNAIKSAQDALAAVLLAKNQEQESYTQATNHAIAEDKRKDAEAVDKYTKEEARAKSAYDKKLAALQKELADEDTEYAKAVTREQARYDDQIARLNAHYARQEAETAKHIARMEEAAARSAAKINKTAAEAAVPEPSAGNGPSEFERELRKMLEFAGKTTDEINAEIAAIGRGELTVGDILPDIADGFKKQADAAAANGQKINQMGEAYKLFGRGASADLLTVLQQGGDAFKEDSALAEHFGLALSGPAKQGAADYIKANADLHASLRGLKVTLGTELMPIVTQWFNTWTTWINGHRGEIVGFFEQVGRTIREWGDYLIAHKSDIIGFFQGLKPTFDAMKTTADAVVKFFHDDWPQIQFAIEQTWLYSKPFIDFFVLAFQGVTLALQILSGDWGGAWTTMKNMATQNWVIIQDIWKSFGQIPQMVINLFATADWSGIWNGVTNATNGLITYFGNLPGQFAGAFGHGFDFIWQAFKDAVNKMIRAWNNLSFSLPGVNSHIPGVGTVGGFTLDTPNIPLLATGGTITAGGWAVVGDNGPELVRLDRGAQVQPLGGGGPAVHIEQLIVNEAKDDPVRTARNWAWQVAAEMRARGMWVAA